MSTAKTTRTAQGGGFEHFFEFSPYSIMIHGSGKISNVNQTFLDLYHYPKKEDLIGNPPISTVIHEEDVDLMVQAMEKVENGGSFFVPMVRALRSDSSYFLVNARVATTRYDGAFLHHMYTTKVQGGSQSESDLLESGRKYRTLFENSLDGIYKSTPAGRFVDVNPAMVEMLGYDSVEELMAIDIKSQLYFKPEDRKIMATKEEDQYPLKKKDGSKIWVEDHGHYEYDEKGEIIFNHGILRDVTGKLEKQKELEDLLEVTEDQNKRLQSFAHIISHNIRSHSANLSSLVQFMEEKQDEAEKAGLFEMLKISTSKLEETIQNLNEIITVNRNLSKPKEFRNLKTEVENTLRVLSGDILSSDAEVIVEVSSDVKVKVIPAYLDSILLNIISNALKYASEKRRCKITITCRCEERFTVLDIADNGIGIDLSKYSDKLFRMYETFSYNKDSRGFGLYITKNQIEAMNGKIDVMSAPGKGSTFSVFFKA